jgi:hypothetical protein
MSVSSSVRGSFGLYAPAKEQMSGLTPAAIAFEFAAVWLVI